MENINNTIPLTLISPPIASHDSKMEEIEIAARTEMSKPIQDRNHRVLLFLEQQRQKYAAPRTEALNQGSGLAAGRHPSTAIGALHSRSDVPSPPSSRLIRILSLGGIGDAILLTPLLRALAQADPKRSIIIWADRTHESVFRNNPNVSKFRSVRPFHRLLYQAALGSKWLPFVTVDYGCFVPSVIYDRPAVRIISEIFNVSLHSDAPELFLTDAENRKAAQRLNHLKRPVVAIHIQAKCSANKNWSRESWKALLSACPDLTFVQIGGRKEPVIEGAHDFTGTTLREAFAILKQSNAFVGIESGFAHASAAVGTPGVVLFGPSAPSVWGHSGNINIYSKRYCSPCLDLIGSAQCPFSNACMNEISISAVEDALRRILSARS